MIKKEILCFSLLLVTLMSPAWAGSAFLPRTTPEGQPVYRFWSDVFNHQFLTITEDEKNHIIANDSNWRYDGIAFYAYSYEAEGTVPLYRFWSDIFMGHFFTIDEAEKEAVINNSDWTYEGIAYYVYPDSQSLITDVVPIHRLWSDQNYFQGHFYSSFDKEVISLDNTVNYAYEGIAFYGIASPSMCKSVGAMINPFQDNWSNPPPYDDYKQGILDYHSLMGKQHNIVMFFAGWEDDGGMYGFGSANPTRVGEEYESGWLANQITEAGATPMITWEPWKNGAGDEQPSYSLDNITYGVYDTYLIQYASDVKNWGHPILLRPMHEMNGNYYPWSCSTNGNDPTKYVAAFRHIVDIFNSVGADNASFVWSPNYASPSDVVEQCSDFTQLYPGDEYVDYIGVSVYNWGSDTSRGPGWVDLEYLIDDFLNTMAKNFPDKEVILSETGTGHDQGAVAVTQWLENMYSYLSTRGTVSAIVYFDDFAFHDSNYTDFRITTGHDWGQFALDSTITEAYKSVINYYCD